MIAHDTTSTPFSTGSTPDQRRPLSISISMHDGRRLIHVIGDLDFASRDVVHGACVVDDAHEVTIDLRAITFLDCGGYNGLLAARHELESRGGSLVWSEAIGQPARFLGLVSALDRTAVTSESSVAPF